MFTIKSLIDFITNPKTAKIIGLAAVAVFILLFLKQCDKINGLKHEVELGKKEVKRVENNLKASSDSIIQYKVKSNAWMGEKSGYELKISELKDEYFFLLGEFEFEKNKPPKTIIKTEYIIEERIVEVPVFVETDEVGSTKLIFNDSVKYNSSNFRVLSGSIPYSIAFNPKDSTYILIPGLGDFSLDMGMNLNLGLFQDKKTREIKIKAETSYPGITFTKIDGASIMDDPESRKVLRQTRKSWSIGLSLGYGVVVNTKSQNISHGPYMGVGLNYSPKFLQWGK